VQKDEGLRRPIIIGMFSGWVVSSVVADLSEAGG